MDFKEYLISKVNFSQKEANLASILLDGKTSTKELAATTGTSEKTVKFHLTNIYKKSEVKSRSQFIQKFLPLKFTL